MDRHPVPLLADLASRTRGGQQGLLPGNEDRVGYWLTPPEVMEPLHDEFHFDFDACPYPRPAGFDGLREPWGQSTWCNPPFVGPGSSRTAWVRKAIAESQQGKDVVLILPVDRYLLLLLEAGAEFRAPEPFKWLDPKGRPQRSARPGMLFVLKGAGPRTTEDERGPA